MSAVISADGLYRYQLHRQIGTRKYGFRACVIMVNPSTADAENDDATIRKIIGFGKSLQWVEFTVVNKFAYRATDVNVLRSVDDPIGPFNDGYILDAMMRADIIVVAWGRLAKLPLPLRRRWRKIVQIAGALDKAMYCWGTCDDGQPCHPVMLAYATDLIQWEPPL